MPNTLVHVGVQALLTRAISRDADPKWIYIGCVIPDLGWILNRAAGLLLPPSLWPDLKLYAVAQTSLLWSLLLAAGVSLCTSRPKAVMAILSFNVLLHLLLDACEIKWANGIVLFAPFAWEPLSWGQVWPESWLVHLLTMLGLAYVTLNARRAVDGWLELKWPGWARGAFAALLFGAFLLGPAMFLDAQKGTDGHFVETLRPGQRRAGAYIELDRAHFERRDGRAQLRTSVTDVPLAVRGLDLPRATVVSIRGSFVDENTIQVFEYHDHGGMGRDLASIVGLGLIALLFVAAWMRYRARKRAVGRPCIARNVSGAKG